MKCTRLYYINYTNLWRLRSWPILKCPPTLDKNSTMFLCAYHSALFKILKKKMKHLKVWKSQNLLNRIILKLSATYMTGLVVLIFSEKWFWWFPNISSIFCCMDMTFFSIELRSNGFLSLVFPLGSPICAVAPPSCKIYNLHLLIASCVIMAVTNWNSKHRPKLLHKVH